MAKTELTKKALAESLKSIMRTSPFAKISVDEICEAAGVSRRNFYRHFPDKYELLNWIYDKEFCSAIHGRCFPRTLDILPPVCAHLYKDRAFYLNAFDVRGQNSFRDFCAARLYCYMEKDYGCAFNSQSEEHFYLDRIIDAVFDAFQLWLKSEPCVPAEDFSKAMIDSITRFAKVFNDVAASECQNE